MRVGWIEETEARFDWVKQWSQWMQRTLLSSLVVKMEVMWVIERGLKKAFSVFFWKDDLKMIKHWWEDSSKVYSIRFLRMSERQESRNKLEARHLFFCMLKGGEGGAGASRFLVWQWVLCLLASIFPGEWEAKLHVKSERREVGRFPGFLGRQLESFGQRNTAG